MTSRVLETDQERDQWIALLNAKKLPMTVSVEDGRRRSVAQNRLQRMWVNEAAEQLGEYTAEEYRAYCKAYFGVKIMCEDPEWAEAYNNGVRKLSYEEKLAMMAHPMDFPITRHMTVKQKKAYLDAIYQHFSSLGVKLTETEAQ